VAEFERTTPTSPIEDMWDGDWTEEQPPWFPSRTPDDHSDEVDLECLHAIEQVLTGLDDRARDILRRRIGLESGNTETLQRIGDFWAVSRERIRQIEFASEKRLRSTSRQPRERPIDFAHQFLLTRLSEVFRTRPRTERAEYLRGLFPETDARVIGRFISIWAPANADQIQEWVSESDLRQQTELEELARQARHSARQARHSERLDAALFRLTRSVLWPDNSRRPWRFQFTPIREADHVESVFSAKLGRQVGVDSWLEVEFVRLFDQIDRITSFCEQPMRVSYPWFDRTRSYVPDFAVELDNDSIFILEVKPPTLWADGMNIAKWNAAVRLCHERGWGFAVSDFRRAPKDFLGKATQDDFAVLEDLTASGTATYRQIQSGWFGTERTWKRLIETSLDFGFAILREPFRVKRARNSPWLDQIATDRSRPGA
jgi:hypothetical protein